MIRKIKKNPKDREILRKIKIQKIPESHQIRYKLFYDDKYIGNVYYDFRRGFVTFVEIDEKFKRKGITTYVYDYIEKDQKIKLKPGTLLTHDAEAFWKNRLKSRNPENTHFEIETELQSKVYKYMSRHYDEYSSTKDLVKATAAHFKIKNIGTPNSRKIHWIWEILFLVEGLM